MIAAPDPKIIPVEHISNRRRLSFTTSVSSPVVLNPYTDRPVSGWGGVLVEGDPPCVPPQIGVIEETIHQHHRSA
ncbi:hypothetical protein C0J29_32395 (plasmid) [Mycobacterium paragordonae]|uniref:Uncharacterized protein n=1 Tax=Mycobacterium paragordonae TaxID=1389713 RepID=A0ABQ1CGE1_9MYCO|nr:hypothetical protein C0J29_32395 [Mycobacterium paragordonae]GFG83275.1 hypothetical protein MPRG_65510 [Mycobacterium paragordonae]